jgi:signal transduction histidine kinase
VTATTSRRVANAVVVACLALYVVAGVFTATGRALTPEDQGDLYYITAIVVGSLIYLWVGRLIVTRQPGNTIGWLLLAVPAIGAVLLANGGYVKRALVLAPGTLPFGMASAWVDRWLLVVALAAFIPIFLLFPDGRLPSRRWRVVGVLTFGAPLLTALAFAVTPGRLTGAMTDLTSVHVTNPLGIDAAKGAIDAIGLLGGFLTFATAIAGFVALVLRYRRASSEVRQQIRWLALVGAAFFGLFAANLVLDAASLGEGLLANVMFSVLLITLVVGIPVACGVAILKYRLYDLDVVVRKAVIFAVLAAFIALVYAAIVGGVGALVGSRSNTALAFAAAAVLAIAFQPARERARRFADRVVYGKRATPYEVLSEFSGRVGEAYATEDVLPRMAQILGEGTGASAATVWLRVGGELRPAASWPGLRELEVSPIAGDVLPDVGEPAVEVRDRGDILGALSVEMPPADPMTPAKERLVADLAAQAGLVLRNVRLIEELRASRQRLVAAQDEERRKLERNLHDGAQQQLVALQVQLRLAEQLVGRDPDKEREILHRLQGGAATALEDLRELARGIYPPLLADQGLGAALESQARKAAISVRVETDGIGRYARDVESAIYFCSLEALNNIAKYAAATSAEVRLSRSNGQLVFEIADDGRGFDTNVTSYGTGLQGMADRLEAIGGTLEVTSAPGRGTTIVGRAPADPTG